jgi:hypothetical protein
MLIKNCGFSLAGNKAKPIIGNICKEPTKITEKPLF